MKMEDKAPTYTDSLHQRQSLKKVLGHSDNDDQLCFGSSVENRLPVSITFKQSNGVEDSLAYMQLTGQRHLPNKGIILMFNAATVIIRGVQLEALFKELTMQRVAWVGLYNVPYEADKLTSHIVVVESLEVQYHNNSIDEHMKALEKDSFERRGYIDKED